MANNRQVGRTERGLLFEGEKEEAGRGNFEETRVVTASHWLNVAVSQWLKGSQELKPEGNQLMRFR